MAERRMFAKTIIDSDAFLDMPLSTQSLYFHLSMRADDEGFINNPKKIQRMIGASEDDLKLLIAKSFIIPFESGIVVIKHWKIHNYIQSDRYKPTVYTEERALLSVKDNKAYTLDTECIQDGYRLETQDSIGKDSIGKISIDKEKRATSKRFSPPSVEDVRAYCSERNNGIDAETFVDFYTSKGWKVGNNPMKDWKAAIRTWEKRHSAPAPQAKVDEIRVYSIDEADENPPYYGLPQDWFDNGMLVRDRITKIKQPALKHRGMYEDVIYSEKEVFEKYLLRKQWFDEEGNQ